MSGWHTPAQAAALLGLHPRTVRDMCADGRIRRTKTTGPAGQPRYRIHDDDIRAWLRIHYAA